MPWHGNSEYAHSSQFQPLTRDERARWRFLTNAARSRQLITATEHDVAQALLWHHGPTGRCDPTLETLARAARCCARTAGRAIQRLRDCGLLAWTQRLVRTRDGARQTSSAYRLTLADLTHAAARRAPRPDRQAVAGTRNIEKREAQSAFHAAAAASAAAARAMLDDLRPTKTLAEIARDRTAFLAAAWNAARRR